MKSQVDNNDKLHRMIVNDMLAHEMLETKMKCASVLKGVLVNNLSEEEIKWVINYQCIIIFLINVITLVVWSASRT